ncbi:RloB domain-containing protein [Candidatus Parcubacteria bacterium]|nr:RloB domain-containing protein [Candidatus Parcubacteria bacterium]
MSRTNPYKRKRRQANKTLLIFGEGMNEQMFLKHLKKLYCCDTNVAITVRKGRGGNSANIVIDASRVLGEFDRRVVVLDNDKPKGEIEEARKIAGSKKIELIENTPCLEHLLLSILGSSKISNDSPECKKMFESEYINKRQRKEAYEYNNLFKKELLEEKRKTIKILDDILQIMEGK